ncbi:MAG TPA: helix-turn-helix domain-containing protein [Elusimicrobiota bacterium]|nr:helix-turn-helix domain-containing protein [Elusimicrobiota bacterium]HNI57618.1 helix-turn-helix domain-containing protein [Elusimicrobiota bacterium]
MTSVGAFYIKTPMPTEPRPTREVMDIRELASYLGIGKSKIYGLIRARKIPAARIGRQYRFSKDVIDAWLRESLITQPPEPQRGLFGGPSGPA